MRYTLGEAAKAAGFSKTTLSRAVRKGALSATRLEDGSYRIDPAELERWIGCNGHRNGSVKRIRTPDETPVTPPETPEAGPLQVELATLRAQLRAAETAQRLLEERMSDLQDRAERAEAKEDRLLALIADLRPRAPEPAPPTRRGLWARLMG
jgi:excisionase family DNA binding protein